MQNNRGYIYFQKVLFKRLYRYRHRCFFIAFFIRAWGDMHGDFNEQNVSAISLDAWNLLYYSLQNQHALSPRHGLVAAVFCGIRRAGRALYAAAPGDPALRQLYGVGAAGGVPDLHDRVFFSTSTRTA